jgi:DNA-binding beta-propeller fold protein YncE
VSLVAAACGGHSPAPAVQGYPESGLALLSLNDGSARGSASIGSDPVAVIVSDDGATAFLADSAPGDVYAVRLPGLQVAWKHHVGGAPFGLLLRGGHLFVSLFSGAAVVELDPKSGAQTASHAVTAGPAVLGVSPDGRVMAAGTRGQVDFLDGTSKPAGHGFGIAVVNGQVWTADYERAELVRADDGHRVGMPQPVFPFWLAPGSSSTLLIAAEGATEDTDPGGVFSFDTNATFNTLAHPRDPDQVVQSGPKILVAAHGDHEVLVIDGGRQHHWAMGSAPVAIAPDPALNLLVVAVNAHE